MPEPEGFTTVSDSDYREIKHLLKEVQSIKRYHDLKYYRERAEEVLSRLK